MHTAKKFFQNAVVSIALAALVTAPMLAHAGPQAMPAPVSVPATQQVSEQLAQYRLIESMNLADVSNETAGEVRGEAFPVVVLYYIYSASISLAALASMTIRMGVSPVTLTVEMVKVWFGLQ